jgi:hypothetical protein
VVILKEMYYVLWIVLKVFENGVLMRIGPEKDEVMVVRRKLHSEKLYNAYRLTDIVK